MEHVELLSFLAHSFVNSARARRFPRIGGALFGGACVRGFCCILGLDFSIPSESKLYLGYTHVCPLWEMPEAGLVCRHGLPVNIPASPTTTPQPEIIGFDKP